MQLALDNHSKDNVTFILAAIEGDKSMIGKIINERYKIVDKLGGGGMSTVYLAEDTILNIKVAIKAIFIPPREKKKH